MSHPGSLTGPRASSRGSSGRLGNGNAEPVLTRTTSTRDSGPTDEAVKSVTQRFDLEIVFKLVMPNRGLSRMGGCLDRCINLVELNLTGNTIAKIEGLEACSQLRRLVLTSNRITRVEGVAGLTRLEGLWVQDNKIATLDCVALPELAALPALRTLCLMNVDRSQPNPVCRLPGYKAAVLAALPGLTNLDGERSPCLLNYAELSAEMEAFRANPPPPKEWVLPEVPGWLQGVNPEAVLAGPPGGPGGPEAELQRKHGVVVKALDECEMLTHVLREELNKLSAQLEEKQGQEA